MSILHQIVTGVAACTGILMVFMAVVSIGLGIQYVFNTVKKWLV